MESLDNLVTEQIMETENPAIIGNDIGDKMLSQESILPAEMSGVEDQPIALEWKCLVCDALITSAVIRYDVLYTMLPRSGVLLCNSLNKVMRTNYMTTSTMRSTVICQVCLNLFDDLELAEEQCRRLRFTLTTNFAKTCAKYGELLDDSMYGVACQTDLLGDDLLLQVKKEEIPLKQKQRKSSRKKTTKTKAKKYSQMSDLSDEDYMDEDRDDREVADSGDNAEYVTTPMIKPDPDAESKPDRPKRKRIRLIHPCEYCPRKFRSQAEVKNHVLVKHLGKNPNHCLLCVKDFNSRNGLNIHLKTIHNVGYSDQKELVCNLLPDSEVKETVDPELLIQQQKILEDIDNLAQTELDEILDDGEVDVDAEDNVRLSDSGSDWAQDSDTPKKKKKSLPIPRPRPSRSRRKEKENLGARSNSKVVTVKYLSEDGIGEEKYVVKEENEEVKEKKEEMEEEKKPKTKAPRKRNRKPRIGERACMPLIHECPTCGKKWRTVSELNAHIQTHSDLRPFVCEICGQGYKMRKALLVHVGMHNGIHPFICHFCNKSFTQKVGLEKHMYIHTGTRRYQCDLCGKGFIHLKSYQIHKMIHSGERHIKCEVCSLALLSKSHLKQHMRVHTGERPHECEVCGKRFAKRSNLNAHKKKVHQLVPGVVPIPPVPIPATQAPPGILGVAKENDTAALLKPRSPIHKCQMCSFKSSRKESLQEHWEREHNRFLNTYTGEYEEYAM